jgi:hypothetical protein
MSVARPGRHVTCTSCHSPSPSTVLGGTGPHHVKSTPAVASLQVAAALGPRVLAGRTNRHTVQRESGGVWKTRMTAEARIAAAGEVPWVPQTVT